MPRSNALDRFGALRAETGQVVRVDGFLPPDLVFEVCLGGHAGQNLHGGIHLQNGACLVKKQNGIARGTRHQAVLRFRAFYLAVKRMGRQGARDTLSDDGEDLFRVATESLWARVTQVEDAYDFAPERQRVTQKRTQDDGRHIEFEEVFRFVDIVNATGQTGGKDLADNPLGRQEALPLPDPGSVGSALFLERAVGGAQFEIFARGVEQHQRTILGQQPPRQHLEDVARQRVGIRVRAVYVVNLTQNRQPCTSRSCRLVISRKASE